MFTNGQLKRLIFPLIIEQILMMLVGMADTIMISYAGEAAISGVSLVDMVNNLIIYVLAAIATGGAVIVSQYLGNKDYEKACFSASQLLMIAFLISTGIMILCFLFYQVILSTLFGSVEANVMEAAITYFLICSLSLPFLGIYNASSALYRSMANTRVTMYVTFWMNLINIIGNMIGIFIFHAGVVGVAIPTLFARVFAGIVMLALCFQKQQTVYVTWKQILVFDAAMMKRILRIALPNGIENGLFHLGKVLVTSIVALFGTAHIAANGVANSIDQIVPIVVNAMNLAIVTVVGQSVGANAYEDAKLYIRKFMRISYLASFGLSVLVFFVLPYLLQLYSLSDEVFRLAYILIIMHNMLGVLLHPTSFVLANGIRAAGDVKFTMMTGILSMLIFRLGTAWLFGIEFELGVIGVWIAMGMDWLCRSILFMIRYRSEKWTKYRAIS